LEKAHFFRDAKQAYLTTVQSLSVAIESKDTYTRGHSDNVAKYAVIIAKELKMDSKDIENINLAATLHDIGKIGVSDVILTKPAKLTPEEYEGLRCNVLAQRNRDKHFRSRIKRLEHLMETGEEYPIFPLLEDDAPTGTIKSGTPFCSHCGSKTVLSGANCFIQNQAKGILN